MTTETRAAVIIGAGPAGLAAAEILANAGAKPLILDAMPSPARKFLMAGKSGLNLTKNEPPSKLKAAINCPRLDPVIDHFDADATMAWAEALGENLFTGSSGRVFPNAMKASPLLRKWLVRLEQAGAELRTRWRWRGWEGGALLFDTPSGAATVHASATILALGGASWPRLGSDGGWVDLLRAQGANVSPFRPANVGFERSWSPFMRDKFVGAPVKSVALSFAGRRLRGEFVISDYGVEGGGVYALSAPLRDALEAGPASLTIDLKPDMTEDALAKRLSRPRGKASRSNHLRKAAGIDGVKAALLRELAPEVGDDPASLAKMLKALPMPLDRPRPIEEAISSAGGVTWDSVDEDLMLRARPGVYAVGEMLDWEAPTGGYLITACLATGRWAGRAAAERV